MTSIRHPIFVLTALSAIASFPAFADDATWQISKSSGEVWVVSAGAQQVKLSEDVTIGAGDTLRTGRTGRVLLKRGAETIAIFPNSVVSVPSKAKDGMQTTITQQAGSIFLDVEKKNVSHFEVETPYLAAVVKGTQFRINVTAKGASVNVLRGQVQVADFRSGQIAQILPGQMATAPAIGRAGLSLSGAGSFGSIEQGAPRASSISRVPVPASGLGAPSQTRGAHIVRPTGDAKTAAGAGSAKPNALSQPTAPVRASNVIRIGSPIGEVRLNVTRHSNGLTRNAGNGASGGRNTQAKTSVWESRAPNAPSVTTGPANTTGNFIAGATSTPNMPSVAFGNSAGASNDASPSGGTSANAGNGRGNSGNGNGNGGNGNNGNGGAANSSGNGNGNANGNGNGNGSNAYNGNGNGRGNNGNGNGNGGPNGTNGNAGGNNGSGSGNGNGNGNGRGNGRG